MVGHRAAGGGAVLSEVPGAEQGVASGALYEVDPALGPVDALGLAANATGARRATLGGRPVSFHVFRSAVIALGGPLGVPVVTSVQFMVRPAHPAAVGLAFASFTITCEDIHCRTPV